jgi:DNA-binding GntR family transcriptional regulator
MVVNQRTLTAQAYDESQEAILAGKLRPGCKVVVRSLAEKLGLSPTPVNPR